MAKRDLAAELLRELGQDRTQYHSGEELSVRLGVSRTAVWKAACRLREQGYAIESVTRLGYRLTALPDGMTKELLEQYLPQGRGETVICYEETDSTNTRGMQLALEGAPTGPDDPETKDYRRAVQLVVENRKASTSWLQRQLGVGYNTAAKWVERMEADGFVGPANHVGRRDIYRDRDGNPL